jgi:hypothetical protein
MRKVRGSGSPTVSRNCSPYEWISPVSGGVGDPVAVELEEIVGGCHQPPLR